MEITYFLSLSVLVFLSIQTVNSLDCITCNDANCDTYKTVTCPEAGAACQTVSFKMGDVKRVMKGCSSSMDSCQIKPPNVPQDANINCCQKNLCNSAITTKMSLLLAGFLVLMSLCVSRF
ncbi:three-finger toxin MALT0070C-like [Bufo gargarizans]|uniref:three-finger toxin MALT0070C-like n=1 Tax=Bufo gargarizans TaxID=30331 RepID=UPI001CF3E0D3|nr:three-finger toxin MALT0070C-like [Bufo gargarizans]